jgi:hypothetical protein
MRGLLDGCMQFIFYGFVGLLIVIPSTLIVVFLAYFLWSVIVGCINCDPSSVGMAFQIVLVVILLALSVLVGFWMKER